MYRYKKIWPYTYTQRGPTIIDPTSIPDLLTLVRQFLVIGKRNIAERYYLRHVKSTQYDKNVCNFIWALKGDYSQITL